MITLTIAGHTVDGYEAAAAVLLCLVAYGIVWALWRGTRDWLDERHQHRLDVPVSRLPRFAPFDRTVCSYQTPAPNPEHGLLVCALEDGHPDPAHYLVPATRPAVSRWAS